MSSASPPDSASAGGTEPPAPAPRGVQDAQFRLLVENVRDYAIFLIDPHGHILTWNAGAEQIKGYKKEEIVGRHISVFYTPDAIARQWPTHELAVAREQGRFEDEGWRVRKDGSRFWANIVITAVRDEQSQLIGFAKITRDMTSRVQIESLQRSGRQINEFLAMLAHELRNPLSPIQSALDIIERKPDDAAARTWAHDIIRRQTRQLSRLVDDLLDVGRITRGKIALARVPIDIRESVREVVESFQSMIEARRHEMHVVLPDEPLFVEADPTRLAQVLANLLGNAIKYTPDGGRIEIRAGTEETLVIVKVSDNGIGMSPDLIPRVFDLFVQGDRALDRREGGLGVGLTLAKRLVDLQGGTLSAASGGRGLGSSFTMGFPRLSAERVRARSAAPVVRTKARRILVVDDNKDAADSLGALLEVLGHEAIVLQSGHQALHVAAADPPDFVLLDIGLPGMDGFEVARRMREVQGLERVRIVACTGYGREDDMQRVGEAGFDGHLVKPVTAATLERLLAD